MTGLTLLNGRIVDVLHFRTDEARARIRVQAILTQAESAKMHVKQNGFRAVQLTRQYKTSEVRLLAPPEFKGRDLLLTAERAAGFSVKFQKPKENRPAQHVLNFCIYASGAQLEAVDYLNTVGECRVELKERYQQEKLFDAPPAAAGKRKRGRPPKVQSVTDVKKAAAGDD